MIFLVLAAMRAAFAALVAGGISMVRSGHFHGYGLSR
jgi:hypothetical protein